MVVVVTSGSSQDSAPPTPVATDDSPHISPQDEMHLRALLGEQLAHRQLLLRHRELLGRWSESHTPVSTPVPLEFPEAQRYTAEPFSQQSIPTRTNPLAGHQSQQFQEQLDGAHTHYDNQSQQHQQLEEQVRLEQAYFEQMQQQQTQAVLQKQQQVDERRHRLWLGSQKDQAKGYNVPESQQSQASTRVSDDDQESPPNYAREMMQQRRRAPSRDSPAPSDISPPCSRDSLSVSSDTCLSVPSSLRGAKGRNATSPLRRVRWADEMGESISPASSPFPSPRPHPRVRRSSAGQRVMTH